MRWNLEVTFFETRAHLGVETQRQWSDKAIQRTTPLLMGLYSIVTLIAVEMNKARSLVVAETTSWYDKQGELTFVDIIAVDRGARPTLARREKRFKNWPRKWKLDLIERMNPTWCDLYKDICC